MGLEHLMKPSRPAGVSWVSSEGPLLTHDTPAGGEAFIKI